MLGYCGIDCEECPVYLKTAKGDDVSFQAFVTRLVEAYGGSRADYESQRCWGCSQDSKEKSPYCSVCKVATCSAGKGFQTCAECPEYGRCPILSAQWESAIQPARINLESLRRQ
jgi:hypothetical protein